MKQDQVWESAFIILFIVVRHLEAVNIRRTLKDTVNKI